MSTPVLTKQQQRKSLSAKKEPVKGLRNVLAVPFDRFWPLLKNENELSTLETVLKKLMIPLKHTTPKIAWKQLRKMSKEERCEARKKMKTDGNAPDEDKTKSIVTGINAVTRSLEKKNLCSIVLDSTVDPPFLIRHIISMSVNENIPVILTPFLKKITLETMDFASAAIGFTKFVTDPQKKNEFSEAHKIIQNIYKNIPKPKRASQSFQRKSTNISFTPAIIHLVEENIDNEKIVPLQQLENIEKATSPTQENNKKSIIPVKENIHKFRSSTKERAFVPPAIGNSAKEVEDFHQSNDFIGLGDGNEFDNVKVNTQKRYVESSYAPLKVKRLRGNPNRFKAGKMKK